MRNNILHQRNPSHLRGCVLYGGADDALRTDDDYNAWGGNAYVSLDDGATRQSLAAWQAAGHEPHSLAAHITNLVAAAPGDYHLRAGSVAIDTGQTLPQVTADLEWLARPAGSASDLGAYEYGASPVAPRIRSLALCGSGACLEFASLPGLVYRVESADTLTAGFGGVVTQVVGTGLALAVCDTDAGTVSTRCYRVWAIH